MQLNLSSAKLSGNPQGRNWSHIYNFEDLYVLVSASEKDVSEDTEVAKIGKGNEIVSSLYKSFDANKDQGIFASLKKSFSENFNKYSSNYGDLQIATIFFKDNSVYLFSTDKIEGYILRNGSLIKLTQFKEGDNTVSVSGLIKEKDKFLLATSQFFSEFSEGVVKGSLESGNCEDFIESFAPSVYAKQDSSHIAALTICVAKKAEQLNLEHLESQPEVSAPSRSEVNLQHPSFFKQKIVANIDKILAVLPEKRVTVRSDTVDIDTHRKRKNAPLIGLILLLILSVSIVFGFKQHKQNKYEQNLDSSLSEISHKVTEAKSLANLDTGRAKILLLNARSEINNLKEQGFKGESLDNLSNEIESNLGNIAGIYEQDSKLYLDLSLTSSGFQGTKLDMYVDELVVLDKNGRKLVGIALDIKRTEIISGPDYIPDAASVSQGSGDSYILSRDGIREIGEEVALVVKSQDDWDPQNALIHWFAGNLYVLDKTSNQIFRYPGVVGGFTEKQEWLGSGINLDLASAKSWTIDGEIWILLDDNIKKLSRGVPQSFRISGDESAFSFSDIYTQEEFKYLYLLDSTNSRVLVVTKDGNYKAEYANSELSKATEIVVSEDAKKLIFLSEGKLYELELKHL